MAAPATMKAAIVREPEPGVRRPKLESVPFPSGEGVLVRVTSVGICGTDLHMLENGLGLIGIPSMDGFRLGHEFGGLLDDGRLVAVRPSGECGACAQCSAQLRHLCPDAFGKFIGGGSGGALAEAILVPENSIVVMPKGTDPRIVGLVEPIAVAVHAVNRSRIKAGQNAVIIGAGSIGLAIALVLCDRGIKTTVVARHAHQRNATEKLGATAVEKAEAGSGDVVFDAVCTKATFDASIDAVKPGGTVINLGMPWETIGLNFSMFVKEITFIGVYLYNRDSEHNDFEEAAELLARKPEVADILVTHKFSMEELEKAFDAAWDRKSGAIKVLIYPN
ncbi:alcohol dehydrogenase GroES-like domain family [Hyaloraphidium curvatum]|nr:alcohol dehydrogenase GroES-like domain family [Hyaloraphidium curvatum]